MARGVGTMMRRSVRRMNDGRVGVGCVMVGWVDGEDLVGM